MSEWGIRGALALTVLLAGYYCVATTLAASVRARNVRMAHMLAPNDGRVTALLAETLSGMNATASERQEADKVARRALQQDPTAVVALSVLGLSAEVSGKRASARRLFGYSQTLSRRDLKTQLWAIEDAVARGDVTEALRHYDIALRTSPRSTELLFPVLAGAIADPTLRAALIHTLSESPSWASGFIDYVAAKGPDPVSISALFIGLSRAHVRVSDVAQRAAIDGLLESGRVDQAWAYYAALRRGVLRTESRDPSFRLDLASPSLLDWRPVNDVGINGSILVDEGGGVFEFSASSSASGPLLEQMQLLPPGHYRLLGKSEGIDQSQTAQPYWSLSCVAEGKELGRVAVPNSSVNGGTFLGTFDVPTGCRAQLLRLVARSSDAVGGATGRIINVRLAPAAKQ